MKETAVQFLIEWLMDNPITSAGYVEAMLKAKELEKAQIVDAWENGYENGSYINEEESIYHGAKYYNKNYNELK